MVVIMIAITATITGLLLFVPPLTKFFQFETLDASQLLICIGIGFLSVTWYELVKIKTRLSAKRNDKILSTNKGLTS